MADPQTHRPVCLVTGGAKRLGKAILTGLAHEFDLAIHANRSLGEAQALARELEARGARAAAFQADFTDPDSAGDVVERAAQHFGRLDLVVNSASLFEYDTAETFSTADMRRLIDINLIAPMVVARAFAKVGSGQATLINMLDNKLYAPNPDYFSYSLGKFALKGATDMLALQFRERMRVCGIAPGITLVSGGQSQESFEKSWRRSLTGAGATPRDIADTVRFIWSTRSLNGETIVLDGGQKLMATGRDVAFLTE